MKTERTRLRRLSADDFDLIRQLESNESVMRYTSVARALSPDESRERLERWLARTDGAYGIWLAEKHEGDFVGWFMLMPKEDESLEIGFMIVEKLWGQGLTSEIAARLMEHAGTRKVVARCAPQNLPSIHVLEKLGFTVVNVEGGTVHLIAGERTPKSP